MKVLTKHSTGLGRGGFFLVLAGLSLFFSTKALAGEAAQFKENEATFYSDLFDQNIYNEGVNQLDLGRWGRKISGKAMPSRDVNLFDEVPDSAFFTNRHGRQKLSPEALERGYQEASGPDLKEPLQVIAAEQRGIYPRFWVRDVRGDEYLLTFDPQANMELVTGAEITANRVYYALGYNVPQQTILFIKPEQFRVIAGATTWEDTGFKRALSQKRFEEYLMVLPQTREGLYRASACKVLKGDLLGPFSFESRRKDDPADLVNHRDRREIRALGIFASWLDHYDLREGDTLDVVSRENGQNVTKHYLVDFSGALGSRQEGPKDPMMGYEHEIDYGETLKAVLALGFYEKPWQKKWRLAGEKISASPAVGYFTNDNFDPGRYKTQFPYEAFRLVTRADGFWAAKLLASFSDQDIRAVVKAAQYSDAATSGAIAQTLIERRDIIVRFWFSRANSLDDFALTGNRLTFKDLAAERGGARTYVLEVLSERSKKKGPQLESGTAAFDLGPEWFSGKNETKVLLRVKNNASSKPGPAVTLTLTGAGIREIRRED